MNGPNANLSRAYRWMILIFLVLVTAESPNARTQRTTSDNAQNGKESNFAELPGNSDNGARIFVAYGCYECHGRAAQGGAGTGPRLAPNPIPVPSMIKELRHPDEMPPYGEKTISDGEISDIHAFLATLPEPPKPETIPILNK
jgi:mono/diheme cytochrome c family protein